MNATHRRYATLFISILASSHSNVLASPEVDRLMETSTQMLKAGKPMDAVAYLQQASSTVPPSALLHFQIGNGYADAKDYQAGIREYNEALKLQPRFPAAVLNTAFAYVNAQQYDAAMPWFSRYIKECPTANNLAEVKSQMLMAQASKAAKAKRYYDAKNFLEQAVAVNPASHTAHFKLARACDELGDTQRAIREYEKCLQLKPNHSPAIFNVAGCYQTLGQTQQAITWFQKYLVVEPNAPDRPTIENMIRKLMEKGGENQADPHSQDYMESIMENGKYYRWSPDRLPLKVYVDGAANVSNFRPAYRTALFDAFSQWSIASQNRLTFVLVTDSRGADIACDWTANAYDVRQSSGSDVEQGVCSMQALTNKRTGASVIGRATLRICILDRETQKPLSDDDMKITCLHEVGHALGLRGHSSNNHDIMFYSVSPTIWPVLSKRDKATLSRLYENYPTQRAADAAPYQ